MASYAGASSEIEVNQQKTLLVNEKEIITLMDMDNVLKGLSNRYILTTKDIQEIKLPDNKKDKVKNFIGRLSMRGSEAFSSLIEVLRESGTPKHTKLADLLDECPTSIVSVNQRMDEIRYGRSVDRTLKEHDTRIKNLEDDTRARDEVEKFQKMLESKEAELEQVKAELEQVKAKLQQQENDASVLREENDKLKKRIEDLEVEVIDLRAGKARAEEELKALRERLTIVEQTQQNMQQQMTQQMNDLKMRVDNVDKGRNKGRSTTSYKPAHRFEDPRPNHGRRKPAGSEGRPRDRTHKLATVDGNKKAGQ